MTLPKSNKIHKYVDDNVDCDLNASTVVLFKG